MSTVLLFENREYIASRDAARDSGYSLDYISKLCRSKKLNAKLIGKSWFVEKDSLELFLQSQERIKIENQKRLSRERRSDYRSARIQETAVKLGETVSETAIQSAKGLSLRLPAIGVAGLAVVLTYSVLTGAISLAGVQSVAIGTQKNISWVANQTFASAANTVDFIGDLAGQNPIAWNALRANMQSAVAQVSIIGDVAENAGQVTFLSSAALGASSENAVTAITNAGKNIGSNVYAVLLELHTTAIAYVNGLWSHMAFVAPAREISQAPTTPEPRPGSDTNQPASQGMVVVPSDGNEKADAAQVARIQKSFSDKVSVIPAEDGESGIIRPEFKDTKGSDYVYVLVPVGGDSGATTNAGNPNNKATKP